MVKAAVGKIRGEVSKIFNKKHKNSGSSPQTQTTRNKQSSLLCKG